MNFGSSYKLLSFYVIQVHQKHYSVVSTRSLPAVDTYTMHIASSLIWICQQSSGHVLPQRSCCALTWPANRTHMSCALFSWELFSGFPENLYPEVFSHEKSISGFSFSKKHSPDVAPAHFYFLSCGIEMSLVHRTSPRQFIFHPILVSLGSKCLYVTE